MTLYDVLGVAADATEHELHRAYRQRARALNPDVNPGSDPAAMVALNEAKAVLTDPERRREYDRTLPLASPVHEGWTPTEPPPGFHLFPYGWKIIGSAGFAREADRRHRALSLTAATGDMRPLLSLAPDGVWKFQAADLALPDAQLAVLSALTGLRVLDIANAAITDDGLRHLRPLQRLHELSLWGTRITDEGLRHVAELGALEVLDLRRTHVKGPGLASLHNLDLGQIRLPHVDRGARQALREALPDLVIL